MTLPALCSVKVYESAAHLELTATSGPVLHSHARAHAKCDRLERTALAASTAARLFEAQVRLPPSCLVRP